MVTAEGAARGFDSGIQSREQIADDGEQRVYKEVKQESEGHGEGNGTVSLVAGTYDEGGNASLVVGTSGEGGDVSVVTDAEKV